MNANKIVAIVVVLFGLLMGGLGARGFLSQRTASVNAAPAVQPATTCTDDDDIQDEAENEADDAHEDAECDKNDAEEANEANETNEVDQADEADDAGALQGQTGITADQARAVAEAANPGAKTLAVELDRFNENGGAVLYEVELDNGLDIKVDAADGSIISTEQRDAD